MTAEQWSNVYRREKAADADAALSVLLRGMAREVLYRIEGGCPAQEALDGVCEMWDEIAQEHAELTPGGLAAFYKHLHETETQPESP